MIFESERGTIEEIESDLLCESVCGARDDKVGEAVTVDVSDSNIYI